MIKRLAIPALILSLFIGVPIALVTVPTQDGAPITLVTVAPIAVTLPPCENEDGSGQMLCMWDASERGNGEGTDAIGGDCSVATLGDMEASAWCVRLYAMPATHTDNADGSSVDVPNGAALVSECTDIAFEASQDVSAQNALDSEGWNLTECFKAFAEN
jgi:hypothetical protein